VPPFVPIRKIVDRIAGGMRTMPSSARSDKTDLVPAERVHGRICAYTRRNEIAVAKRRVMLDASAAQRSRYKRALSPWFRPCGRCFVGSVKWHGDRGYGELFGGQSRIRVGDRTGSVPGQTETFQTVRVRSAISTWAVECWLA